MKLLTTLYPHQQEAVEKLSKVKVGALYMEMGTGKTRTALELIERRLRAGKINKVIWLCPCSVKVNLRRGIARHAVIEDGLLEICGIETLSSSARENRRLRQITKTHRCFLVVDESILVKNAFAVRTSNIIMLADACQYKLILNGTPISRNEADLYAQWRILDPRIFGYRSYWSFAANHLEVDETTGRIRNVLSVDYLTQKMAPYTYQILKSDCLNLPEKIYRSFWFSLTDEQLQHYAEVCDMFLSAVVLDSRYETTAIYRVLTALQLVSSGRRVLNTSPLDPITSEPFFERPEDNPRLQALLSTIDLYPDPNEKVIVWGRYNHEIEDIYQALMQQGKDVALFYGALSQKRRQESLDRFAADTRFLVGNKNCAGFGLDLQYSHYAVYYDDDWDWGRRIQSEDRIHRIGQTHNPVIIDLMADSTIDERIAKSNARKENLADSFKANLRKKNIDMVAWLEGKD